jgi:DNA-binding Lrp family transcriptional regulator
MVIAYVMIKANTGEADRLKREVDDIDGVEDVRIVAGDVDLIGKVEVDTPADVKDVAATAIQGIRGVESTQTYIAME